MAHSFDLGSKYLNASTAPKTRKVVAQIKKPSVRAKEHLSAEDILKLASGISKEVKNRYYMARRILLLPLALRVAGHTRAAEFAHYWLYGRTSGKVGGIHGRKDVIQGTQREFLEISFKLFSDDSIFSTEFETSKELAPRNILTKWKPKLTSYCLEHAKGHEPNETVNFGRLEGFDPLIYLGPHEVDAMENAFKITDLGAAFGRFSFLYYAKGNCKYNNDKSKLVITVTDLAARIGDSYDFNDTSFFEKHISSQWLGFWNAEKGHDMSLMTGNDALMQNSDFVWFRNKVLPVFNSAMKRNSNGRILVCRDFLVRSKLESVKIQRPIVLEIQTQNV